jgi:selenocysteine-specific elongation factor
LATKQTGEPADLVRQALLGKPPLDLETLARQAGLTSAETRSALEGLLASEDVLGIGGYYVDIVAYRQLVGQTQGVVRAYHSQFPLRRGIGKEELKSRLGLAPRLFAVLLERWLAEGALVEEGSAVRLPEHQVTYSADQEKKIAHLFALLREGRFSPLGRTELEQQIGLEPAVTDSLAEQGRLVKLTEAVILPVEVYEEMVEGIKARLRAEGKVTVATVRDQFSTSRKYALAILEHLDEQRVTRRVGDERVLR